jgi:hypothetical protein
MPAVERPTEAELRLNPHVRGECPWCPKPEDWGRLGNRRLVCMNFSNPAMFDGL